MLPQLSRRTLLVANPRGDTVLKVVAARLGAVVRPDDLVVRLAGDEFVIVCSAPDALGSAGLRAVCARVEDAVEAPVVHQEVLLQVGASCGHVHASPDEDPQGALARAARAMYTVKRARQERSRAEPAARRALRRPDDRSGSSVATALETAQMEVHQQPG